MRTYICGKITIICTLCMTHFQHIKTASVRPCLHQSKSFRIRKNIRIPCLSGVFQAPFLVFNDQKHNLKNWLPYGFCRKRSTKHAVTILVNDIRTGMDNQQLTGAVFLDLRKAFDTVSHARLLNKLPIYGVAVNDLELQWITIYLFARSHVVNFQGTILEENYSTHGVPQGSILGPLLFTLLINDIGTELSYCKIIHYADDTVIYFSDKDVINIESTLNDEINRVAKWMSDNHLTLNLKKGKTDFILYGRAKRLGKQICNINVA